MEWFAVVTGALGILFGGYGAWRAWRTDRTQKLLGKRWEIEARSKDEYLFHNRQPRTVYRPRIEGPSGHIVMADESVSVVRPNEALSAYVLITYNHDQGPMKVSWHHRPDLKDKPKTQRLYLPDAK
ncbi:hypothetical protein [Microbacterium sp. NPDC087589]|uniref:hypothetical protein n=1 Tax=Microbacterium sp. NPDC087589 TaxID=3364191 RepID=UPI0037FE0222